METALVRAVNNDIYETLGERWYAADDDPVALLRAESRLRNPWVVARLAAHVGHGASVLDVGCGGGFLSNQLARSGYRVTGFDASRESLVVAARHDATHTVKYEQGDALGLPYADESFDAVCAMDFLEHVEEPERVIRECSRVLRPGGVFFFHTFNRSFWAWLVVIKGVEWFVRNTPRDMHVLRLFIRPRELTAYCREHALEVRELHGSKPVVLSTAFFKMLASGVVPPDFRFEFTASTALAYTGYAERRGRLLSAGAEPPRVTTARS